MRIQELEEKTKVDGFWDDPKNGKVIMRQIKDVKSWVTAYDEIVKANDDLGVLYEFAKEGEATEEEVDKQYADVLKLVEDLEFRNMLHDEADSRVAQSRRTGPTCSCVCTCATPRLIIIR